MNDSRTSRESRHKREQQRREQIRGEVGHACAVCTAVAFPEDETCHFCDSRRPADGWYRIEDFNDRWLGKKISNRYVLTRHVGDGSFSSVYRADSLAIPRSFAMKVVHMDADPARREQTRARVDREVQALSRLRNPHVVSFYDVLSLETGEMAFVMDFIEGTRLDILVDEFGRLPVRRTVQITRQLANGVFEAHRAGLVHRDIKPDNIIVEELPAGDDFVHVLDFGIVSARGAVKMTRGFIGTPLYASPEQAQGKDVDQRSDIYSVGAVLFHMLTGRPPFVHDNVLRILDDHVARPAPTLGEVTGESFPSELEELVASLLRKNPADRPTRLSDVIQLLDGLSESTLSHVSTASESSVADSEPTLAAESSPSGTQLGRAFGGTRNDSPPNSLERDESSVVQVTQHLEGSLVSAVSEEWVAFVDSRKELTMIELASGVKTRQPLDFVGDVTALAVCRKYALIGMSSGRIFRVEDEEAELVYEDVRRSPITALAVSANCEVAVAGTQAGKAYVWTGDDNRHWSRFAVVQGDGPIVTLAVNATGSRFAMARADGSTAVYDFATPRSELRVVTKRTAWSVAFSRDGYLLAVLDDDGVRIEAAEQPNVFMRATSPPTGIHALCFSRQNQLMAIRKQGGSDVDVIDIQEQMKRA
jgi:serine/threonine protein kinase